MSSDKKKFILAIDQGTTNSRIIIYNNKFSVIDSIQKEFSQFFPQNGWVEHNPIEIWNDVKLLISKILTKNKIKNIILTILIPLKYISLFCTILLFW